MARLIDADALSEHIKGLPTWFEDGGGMWSCLDGYPKGLFYPEDIISSIENAPIVDAVEVGRCKDCDYYRKIFTGFGNCEYFDIGRADNDYCSSWERKWVKNNG